MSKLMFIRRKGSSSDTPSTSPGASLAGPGRYGARRCPRCRSAISIAMSLAMSFAAALALSGCGSSKKKPSSTESSTTTAIAPALAAAVVAVPSSFADSTAGLDTPEAASQNMWDAWRDDDRTRAALYASNAAVSRLFATPWGPENKNQGCGSASGVLRCVYTLAKGARVMIIEPTQDGKFRVSAVQVVDALPASDRLNSDLVDDTVPGVSGTTQAPDLATGGAVGGVVGQDGVVVNDSIPTGDSALTDPSLSDTTPLGPSGVASGSAGASATASPPLLVPPTISGPATSGPTAGIQVAKPTSKPSTKAKTTKKRKPRITAASSVPSADTPIPVDAGQSSDSAVG